MRIVSHLWRSSLLAPFAAVAMLHAIAWPVAAAGSPAGYEKLEAVSEKLEHLRTDNLPFYLDGQPEKALAAMEAEARPRGWWGLLVIANMTWTMHPQQSLAWHEAAAKASHEHPLTTIELALHYTRHEQCDRALVAWDELQRKGMMGGYFPALKAYCLLRLDRDAEAVAAVREAEFGSHGDMRYAEVLGELWGERPALARYADAFAAYRGETAGASLEAVVRQAVDLPSEDGQRYEALQRLTASAATREPAGGPLMRDLTCLRPLFEQQGKQNHTAVERSAAREQAYQKALADDDYETAGRLLDSLGDDDTGAAKGEQRWRDGLAGCHLMVGDQPLPTSGALLRLLTIELMQRTLATDVDLLARHGDALWTRASSERGDVDALEVLAALQSSVRDRDGLRRSDELGWHRYRLPKFAASRVYGAMLDGKPEDAATQRLLGEALADFPDDAQLLSVALQSGHFDEASRKAAVRRLLLAQHHAPQPMSDLHYGPSASRLRGTWLAYAQLIGKSAP